MNDDKWYDYNLETGEYVRYNNKHYDYLKIYKEMNVYKKPDIQSDEEILEDMDIKIIENFLRKKKLNNISK